jgi:hypothetical protein
MVLRLRDMAHAHQVIQQYESALDQTRAALRESHLILLRAAKLSQSLQREDTSPSVHELRHWLQELVTDVSVTMRNGLLEPCATSPVDMLLEAAALDTAPSAAPEAHQPSPPLVVARGDFPPADSRIRTRPSSVSSPATKRTRMTQPESSSTQAPQTSADTGSADPLPAPGSLAYLQRRLKGLKKREEAGNVCRKDETSTPLPQAPASILHSPLVWQGGAGAEKIKEVRSEECRKWWSCEQFR